MDVLVYVINEWHKYVIANIWGFSLCCF